ncbi:MFS domain-containing protein [Hyphomicrobiales bacterium]|nr:MFS domain-containing protein [Hyphomicrobiales bacterium]
MSGETKSDEDIGRQSFVFVFTAIFVPMFMAIMDQTIVAASLPNIAADLGKAHSISWVVTSYLVAMTIAAPVYGRLGDLFGRKTFMIVSMGIFVTASLACSLAQSMEMLIFTRLLQGLGGGGLITLSQALIGEAIAPRQRARFQGYLATISVTANALGPVAGGYITEHLGWRAIFLVNLPLGLVALLFVLRLKALPGIREKRPFDLMGLAYLSVFVTATLLNFSQAQRVAQGEAWLFAMWGSVSLLALLLLIRHEGRIQYPLLPVKLLRQAVIWRSDALAACHGATLVALVTFVPIYLRAVRDVAVAEIGLLLLPLSMGVGVGSMMTGRAVTKTGHTAIFPSVGLIAASALISIFAFRAHTWTLIELSWLLGLVAVCLGTTMGVVQVTVQSSAHPRVLGAAAASVQLSRSIGAALGTGIVSMVFFSLLTSVGSGVTGSFSDLLQQGSAALHSLTADERTYVEAGINGAFVAAFATIAGFAAIGSALAWSIPLRRL